MKKSVRWLLLLILVVPLLAAATGPASAAEVRETPQRSVSFNGAVEAVAVRGSTVYVVGRFTRARQGSSTFVRRHVAAVDARTGRLLPWRVPVNGVVHTVEHSRGQIYLGGDFSRVGRRTVSGIARVSVDEAKVDRTFRPRVNGAVHAIAVARRRVFLGGEFNAVDGTHRTRLAAVTMSGRVQAWAPRANNTVKVMELKDGLVHTGGLFNAINANEAHGYLVALTASGAVSDRFRADVGYPALDLQITERRVYVAGGGTGGRLTVLDRAGKRVWSRTFDGDVQAVRVFSGRVYAGGHWEYMCSSARVEDQGGDCIDGQVYRPRLASFTLGGDRVDWTPHPDSVEGVLALGEAAKRLVVGGAFEHFRYGAVRQPRFALFPQVG